MKKLPFVLLFSYLILGNYSPSIAQKSDSNLISQQHKYGNSLWTMLSEHYSRYDSVGCEWSNWLEDGFAFSWSDRQNCQIINYYDQTRITFFNYHMKDSIPVCIVLINSKGYYVFIAREKSNGLYYKKDPNGEELSSNCASPEYCFVQLEAEGCRKFNKTIKRALRVVGEYTERMRD